jgi:hypothetical protein
MLLVRATENSQEQTESCIERYRRCGVTGAAFKCLNCAIQRPLERGALEGDSPVGGARKDIGGYPEYYLPETK